MKTPLIAFLVLVACSCFANDGYLPFARRGYVFRSADLQNYFERQKWYKKDESYKAEMATLTPEEQAWVNKW